MRVWKLLRPSLGGSRARPVDDYFHRQSFSALGVLAPVLAWLWVGDCVQRGRLGAGPALALMYGLLVLTWLVYHLQRRHYLWAIGIFDASLMLFIAIMLWLLRDLAVGYLFIPVVVAATLMTPGSAFAVAAAAALVELGLLRLAGGTLAGAATLSGQAVLCFLVAIVANQTALGLREALESAEVSVQEASRHAEEARRRRAELHQTLKSLDLAWAQLQRANSELFYAREAADQALRFKSEFAAQISHELRTSLNLVLGFSETMAFSQNSYGEKLPAPYLRDVTEIYRNSRHLLALIDDILDLSKLEAGRMGLRREPVDLGPMLRETTDIARPLVERKGLELVLEVAQGLPPLLLDRTRIRQVLLNLVSNAVRATLRGRISVTASPDHGQVVVRVSDTGTGIPPEALARVFEEFFQADPAGSTAGGAGLGLAVSKRIVALHGGRMWAESEVGVGSTFSLALPMPEGAAYAQATQTAAPAPSPPQPTVVMIGEEQADEVKLLERHLEGYTVVAAATLEGASELASQVGARAVIANAAVDEAPDPTSLPVPLIACPLPGPQRAQAVMGVACYLQKPVTAEAIRGALRRAAPDARSLLVVDDEPAAVRLIERMVQGSGEEYRVLRAYSGREALARVHSSRPEVVVLDLAMGDGDGIWLISALGRDPDASHIPIIVVTGRAVEEAWQSGPIGILSGAGFTPTEALRYLQSLLAAVPPATARGHTTAPPS